MPRAEISRTLYRSMAGGCVLLCASLGAADQADWDALMTAQERSATGIERLSAAERAALWQWLQRYTDREQAAARAAFGERGQQGVLAPEPEPSEIVSQIKGPFEGWTGNTLFKLANGQVWQQRRSSRLLYRADSPEVIIRRSRAGFFTMEVPEAGRSVLVQRVD